MAALPPVARSRNAGGEWLQARGLTTEDLDGTPVRFTEDAQLVADYYDSSGERVTRKMNPARGGFEAERGSQVKGTVLMLGDATTARTVVVVEGESDGLTVWRHLRRGDGYAVLVLPGTSTVRDDLANFVGTGVETVTVATDADAAGDECAERVHRFLIDAGIDGSAVLRYRPKTEKPNADVRDDINTLQSALADAPSDEVAAQVAGMLATAEPFPTADDTETDPGADTQTLITPWDDFDTLATGGMRFRVNGIWPADGLGFIAAPPKHGKTWLGLALAISVATGRPFLGQHTVEQCPVVYVALEGSPGGVRARIGAISRGMGVDPDSHELRGSLHLAYKPRGLNLSDTDWAERLITDVRTRNAGLVVVDVLRRAATIRESGDGVTDFANLIRNLEPLQDHGRSLAFCHHFRKDGKTDDDIAAGQRMAGSGSLHGHYDAAIFITSYQPHDREMRVEIDGRDFTPPRPFRVTVHGTPSGPYGYVYEDAAELTVTTAPRRKLTKAAPDEIRKYIEANGGSMSSGPILAHFDMSDETLRKRRDELAEIGVEYGGEGREARYVVTGDAP